MINLTNPETRLLLAKHAGNTTYKARADVADSLRRKGLLIDDQVTETGELTLRALGLIGGVLCGENDPTDGYSLHPQGDSPRLPREIMNYRQAVARGGRFVR